MKFFLTIMILIITIISSKKKVSNVITNYLSLEKMNEEIDRALRGDTELKNINNFLTAEEEVNDNNLIDRNSDDNEIEDEVDGHKDNFKLF